MTSDRDTGGTGLNFENLLDPVQPPFMHENAGRFHSIINPKTAARVSSEPKALTLIIWQLQKIISN